MTSPTETRSYRGHHLVINPFYCSGRLQMTSGKPLGPQAPGPGEACHVHSGDVPFHGQHQAVEAGLRARALQDGQHVTMAVGSRGPSMQIWAM